MILSFAIQPNCLFVLLTRSLVVSDVLSGEKKQNICFKAKIIGPQAKKGKD